MFLEVLLDRDGVSLPDVDGYGAPLQGDLSLAELAAMVNPLGDGRSVLLLVGSDRELVIPPQMTREPVPGLGLERPLRRTGSALERTLQWGMIVF